MAASGKVGRDAPLTPRAVAALHAKVSAIALALPETTERVAHGAPNYYLRDRHPFAMLVDDHHRDGIVGMWVAAPPGAQAALIAADPRTFYRPAYVGHKGWVGVRLDRDPDWSAVASLLYDAHDTIALTPAARKSETKSARAIR